MAPVGTMMNDDVIPLVLEFELTGLEMAWFVGSLACMQACVMVILRERDVAREGGWLVSRRWGCGCKAGPSLGPRPARRT